MGLNAGFSSFLLLDQEITKEQRELYFKILLKYDFVGYDYNTETYIKFEDVLKKYPTYPEYLLKYKKESYVFSCQEGDNFLLSRVDAQSKDSKIILKTTSDFCTITASVSFSYIDSEGDPPKKIQKIISKMQLQWLFKYNYFGKAFIEKYGREFFTNMPCVKQEFVTNDIIRIDLVKDIFDETNGNLKTEINEYLEKHSLKVRFYDYRQHYID